MSWARYDDQLSTNAKVTACLIEDPGSMSLHLLANTWTCAQRLTGWVPAHQPAVLMIDRATGVKWADILTRNGLWHAVDDMCPDCLVDYADYNLTDRGGWVFHNHEDYRPPSRERQTPGTPTAISAARREAGRKGGQASAARRAAQAKIQAKIQANPEGPDFASTDPDLLDTVAGIEPQVNPSKPSKLQATVGANPSNRVSPVPVPVPEPSSASTKQNKTKDQNLLPHAARSAETGSLTIPGTDIAPVGENSSPSTKRGTRLPEDWLPSVATREWTTREYPAVDARTELIKFRNHWLAKSGRDATKVAWDRTWQNWIINANERLGGRTGSATPTRGADSKLSRHAAVINELREEGR